MLVAGQLVSSFSSLMLVSVTFFSEVWFSHRERATATAFTAVVGPNVSTQRISYLSSSIRYRFNLHHAEYVAVPARSAHNNKLSLLRAKFIVFIVLIL